MSFFRKETGKVILFVRLTPKAAKDAIDGIASTDDGKSHLKVRVRAVPEDGKANAAVEKLLADILRIPRRDVAVTSGSTSRLKQITLTGNADDIEARIQQAKINPAT